MTVVADTGPLLSAADRRDEVHHLAAELVVRLGRDLVIPAPVLVEADHLMRSRLSTEVARRFLAAVAAGRHAVVHTTPGLLREAVAIDHGHADLDLGYVDATVMAVAARLDAPILTFDFADFRAAPPGPGRAWRLVIDEARYTRERHP